MNEKTKDHMCGYPLCRFYSETAEILRCPTPIQGSPCQGLGSLFIRILVCGGRDYNNISVIEWVLEPFRAAGLVVIQGGARGADALAKRWCEANNITCLEYPADWQTHGKAAGPIRNQQMLDEGKPDYFVAFPGGRGTAHMVALLKKAGIPGVEIPYE